MTLIECSEHACAALVVAAIALTTAPRIARVARGAAQPVVERDFIACSEAMGVPRWRILSGELLPNTLGPLTVEASLRLTYSIGLVAAIGVVTLVLLTSLDVVTPAVVVEGVKSGQPLKGWIMEDDKDIAVTAKRPPRS